MDKPAEEVIGNTKNTEEIALNFIITISSKPIDDVILFLHSNPPFLFWDMEYLYNLLSLNNIDLTMGILKKCIPEGDNNIFHIICENSNADTIRKILPEVSDELLYSVRKSDGKNAFLIICGYILPTIDLLDALINRGVDIQKLTNKKRNAIYELQKNEHINKSSYEQIVEYLKYKGIHFS